MTLSEALRTDELPAKLLTHVDLPLCVTPWAAWHLVLRQPYGKKGLLPVHEEKHALMYLPGKSGPRLASLNWGGFTWGIDSMPLTDRTLWSEGSVLILPLEMADE